MQRATMGDVDIAYDVQGDGPWLVFSHEFAGDSQSWAAQVEYFSRRYRCLTYNHRGFPPSTVPDDPSAYSPALLESDLLGLLDHLSIDQAHFVGLSMGANVVLDLAFHHPERCRSLVVSGCGAGSTNRETFERDIRQIVDLLETKGMSGFAEVYSEGPSRQPFKRKDPAGWLAFKAQFASHSARGSALTQLGVQRKRRTIFSLENELRQLRLPTLILIGDEDEPCIDPAIFMKRTIPSSGLVVLPQTGHTINLEEPGLFNQSIARFLERVETGEWGERAQVTTSLLPD
jgi:pimeloyl-ACP methyl ester carboxylesterase